MQLALSYTIRTRVILDQLGVESAPRALRSVLSPLHTQRAHTHEKPGPPVPQPQFHQLGPFHTHPKPKPKELVHCHLLRPPGRSQPCYQPLCQIASSSLNQLAANGLSNALMRAKHSP